MKFSEILTQAIEKFQYLQPRDDGYIPMNRQYMCYLTETMAEQCAVSMEQVSELQDRIYEDIDKRAFLRDYLVDIGLLDERVTTHDPEYKVVALQFWRDLIAKLESEGN